MTAAERVTAALEAAGSHCNGRDWQCPTHDDRQASLSVKEASDGRVLLYCHAGCPTQAVLVALGLDWPDLFPQGDKAKPSIVATYDYTDQDGTLLYQAVRYFPKAFKRRRPDGKGGWVWNLQGVDQVLYRLPQVLAAIEAGAAVYVVEGEKDVHAVECAGGTATTTIGGAKARWRPEYSRLLAKAKQVVVVADDDPPGLARARSIATAVRGAGGHATVVHPAVGKDAADHLAAGRGLDDLQPLGTPATPAEPRVHVTREQGAAILNAVEAGLCRYIAYADQHQPVAVTLWAAHTHAVDVTDVTPYLHFKSAEPESGKSTNLDLLEFLTPRSWNVIEPTEAVAFRKIAADQPTFLLDEVDSIWGDDVDNSREGLRAIFNAGYRRGATVPRCVGNGAALTLMEFPVFCAKAFAGLRELPRALTTRAIPIRLRRRTQAERVERFRRRRVEAVLAPLGGRLAAWVELVTHELTDADPDLPEALSDRQQDLWEPLLAIADAAGGDWPKRAREAAVHLHGRDPAADQSVGVLLLTHIRDAFPTGEHAHPDDKLTTEQLLRTLVARDDGPWAEWWRQALAKGDTKSLAAKLARLLKPYGIAPKQLKIDGEKTRGYERDSFTDAWIRYLPPGTDLEDGTSVPRRSEALFEIDADSADMPSDQGGTEVPSENTVPAGSDAFDTDDAPPPTDTDDPGRLPGADYRDPARFTR